MFDHALKETVTSDGKPSLVFLPKGRIVTMIRGSTVLLCGLQLGTRPGSFCFFTWGREKGKLECAKVVVEREAFKFS